MGTGNRIRPGVSGGDKKPAVKKYSDRVYKVLLHLREAIDGDQVTGITNMVFLYLDREWTIEPDTRIDNIRLFYLTNYNGKPRLQSDLAGRLLTTWEYRAVENKLEYGFSQLCTMLMAKPRTTRPYRMSQPGDWKRVMAVRKVITPGEKRMLDLMTPGEQTRFYEGYPAFESEEKEGVKK